MADSAASRALPLAPLPALPNAATESPTSAEGPRPTYGPPLPPGAVSPTQIIRAPDVPFPPSAVASGLLKGITMQTPEIEEVDIEMSSEAADGLAGGSTRLGIKLGKRPAEAQPDVAGEDARATKRPRMPTPPERPLPPTDDYLPGYGTKQPDTFMIRLPGGLIRWLPLPPAKPFSTARDKLQVLARIAKPASADKHFDRLSWSDLAASDNARLGMEQRVRDGYVLIVHGYQGDYGICAWDDLGTLASPNEVVMTEYPFHSVGKLKMDNKITLRELHKLGAEGSLQWGSASLPIRTSGPLPPLVPFLADDWAAWNLGSSSMARPPHARPASFAAFNTHLLLQRQQFASPSPYVPGQVTATYQRCGHRLVFYCRPSKGFLQLKGVEQEEMYRMEDYERMGSWFVLVVRPGELLVQPPGPRYALYTLSNTILRLSQFLTYSTLRPFERHLRFSVKPQPWTAEFEGLAVLRTVWRLAIMLQHSRSDMEVPRDHFLAMARMILKPSDYLPPARTEEQRKTQQLLLRLLQNQTRIELVQDQAEGGQWELAGQGERQGLVGPVRIGEERMREEIADYTLAAAVVRKRLVLLGVAEDVL